MLGLAGGVAWSATTSAQACAVCFGAPGSNVNDAMAMAIGFMLLILFAVLGLFISFFFYLRRRANAPLPDYAELTDPDSHDP